MSVIETLVRDISTQIPTNLISITAGLHDVISGFETITQEGE